MEDATAGAGPRKVFGSDDGTPRSVHTKSLTLVHDFNALLTRLYYTFIPNRLYIYTPSANTCYTNVIKILEANFIVFNSGE